MGANLFPGTAGRRTTLPARFSGGRGHKSKRQQFQKDGHSPRNLGAGPAPVKDLKGQGSKGSGGLGRRRYTKATVMKSICTARPSSDSGMRRSSEIGRAHV